MKKPQNITRRSFLKRTGLVGATLCIAPSIAFSGETEENNLRKKVSGLMEEADMHIRYDQENHRSIQLLDPKQIISANIPVKKLYEVKNRLIEHIKEYDPFNEESGVLYVYDTIDVV